MKMIRDILLLLFLLKMTSCWVINVNKNSVTSQFTKNVSITCNHNNNIGKELSAKSRTPIEITIQKATYINSKKQWGDVAKISKWSLNAETFFTTATVEGRLDKEDNSFVKLHFQIANQETVGEFKCEVLVNDMSIGVKQTVTKPVVINERDLVYKDIANIMQDVTGAIGKLTNNLSCIIASVHTLGARVDEMSEECRHGLTNVTDQISENFNSTANQLKQLEAKITDLSGNVAENAKNIGSISMLVEVIENTTVKNPKSKLDNNTLPAKTSWPGGQYALLNTDTGCPENTPSDNGIWHGDSSIRITMNPANANLDKGSNRLNLKGQVFQRINADTRNVKLEMCSHHNGDNNHHWPTGSYCINLYSYNGNIYDNTNCPRGLQIGYSALYKYRNKLHDTVVNLPGWTKFYTDRETLMYFCCKDDGKPTQPMTLPTAKPFMLYKYGGECQQVEGMTVEEQWIRIDTEGKKSTCGYNVCPDGIDGGYHYYLCYYKPKLHKGIQLEN